MYIHRTSRHTTLLRQSYRIGGKVKKQTLMNLSAWSADQIAVLEEALRVRRLFPGAPAAEEAVRRFFDVLITQRPSRWLAILSGATCEADLMRALRASRAADRSLVVPWQVAASLSGGRARVSQRDVRLCREALFAS